MWTSIEYYANAAFNFVLQGNPPQEVIPVYLCGILVMIAYVFVRMAKGNVE